MRITSRFLLFLLWTSPCLSGEITFKNQGKTVQQLDLKALEKLVPSQEVTVFEHHESVQEVYRGINTQKLFNTIYGEIWKESEEVLFTCLDGYQPSIPKERFQKYESYLAFERKGDPKFTLINKLQGNEKVNLGPFYLIWDNLSKPELKKEGAFGWPYQVTTVDLIRFSTRFPNMSPPSKSRPEVVRGFLAFRKHCMSCHTINGEGGSKALELNYPVSVTEYFKEPFLRKWILEPVSIRFNTPMPGLPKEGNWKENLEDILHYLKAMAKNKKKPIQKGTEG